MSTIKVDNLQTSAGAGLYPARSWVSFKGTGTVAINASGNVSSVTDVGVGRYTSNFSTSLASANYSTSFDNTSYETNNASSNCSLEGSSAGTAVTIKTTSAVRSVNANTNSNQDAVQMSHIIIG